MLRKENLYGLFTWEFGAKFSLNRPIFMSFKLVLLFFPLYGPGPELAT